MSRALAKPGAYPASAAKRELLFNAAMEACDGLDGAIDGLINNQLRCNAIFDPATASVNGNPLRCPDGADTGDTCLSDAQITALKTLNSDTRFNFELASGEDGFPGYNMWGADLGITTRTSPLEPTITFLALGTSQPTLPMPSTAPYISKMTDQWIQYFITRSPGYDTFSFDPQNPGPWADTGQPAEHADGCAGEPGRVCRQGRQAAAGARHFGRAGEPHARPRSTTSACRPAWGRRRSPSSPATTKCQATGTRPARPSTPRGIRSRHWRTGSRGTPSPSAQVVTDTAGVPGRTRPLCDFPEWAQYNGTGDLNLAASFTCVEHETVLPTQRQTHLGPILGNDYSATSGTYAWKGIPFAKAPVGDLRWKPPAEPAAWTTPRTAQQFGNACVSFGRLYGPGLNNKYDATIGTTLGQPVGSEDCLYLNIWRPAGAATNLPVIVFVYGGSNVTGYTADPVYDGANLAKTANAVVVTVNYRLSLFGFFNLGQLKTGEPLNDSGNFALLDLIKGLQFINRNIANFGGNPGNVTLMGQSAGAVNVYAVMTSPLVVNANPALVHRFVPISGGIALAGEVPAGSIATLAPASAFRGQADFLLANLVIGDGLATDLASATAYIASQTPEQIATYVRGKSAATIVNTIIAKLAPIGASGSGPIPDGNVLPTSPIAAIRAGQYVKAPVLAGNTRDEGKLFPTLFPLAGGTGSGRLLDDATVFSTRVQLQARRGAADHLGAVDSAVVPAHHRAGHGVQRAGRPAQQDLLPRQPRRRAVGRADPAEQHLVLPLRLGRAARAVQRHLRRGPRLRPVVCVRQLRPLAVRQHRVHHGQPAWPAGAVGHDDAQHRRLRAQRRPQQPSARRQLADLAVDARVRCNPDGQGDLRPLASAPVANHGAPTSSGRARSPAVAGPARLWLGCGRRASLAGRGGRGQRLRARASSSLRVGPSGAVRQSRQQAAMLRMLVQLRVDAERDITDRAGARPIGRVAGQLELDDVVFAYGDEPVIHGISIDVPAGGCIALVGESGGGKSTTAKLIARFYDPDEGAVRVDGTDLRDVQLRSVRRQLGVVLQDPFLFSGTIADNIRFGATGRDRRRGRGRGAGDRRRPGRRAVRRTGSTTSCARAAPGCPPASGS